MLFVRSFTALGARRRVLWATLTLLYAAPGLAQSGPLVAPSDAGTDAAWSTDAGAAADDAAFTPERAPPRALFLPALRWPSDEPAAVGASIEVPVVVERDGRARLEVCERSAPVCEAVRAALVLAEFAPATVRGETSAARVQVRLELASAASLTTGADASTSAASPSAVAGPDASSATLNSSMPERAAAVIPRSAPTEYGAIAHLEREKPLAVALELEETRAVPGAMGDPFRVIDALPGVVPVMTGLPYVYVRGAPPSATAYFYDDIQLPALFHLALGPAVVHPAMVGGIDFYPGVAPARYGRKTGGVVAGKALLRDLKPGVHGELELRLIDIQAYVATPLKKTGRFEIAGRYGYPGLLAKLFDSRAVLQYWDYQLRTVVPLGHGSEATVIALGSFDLVGTRHGKRVDREIELQFHRVEARLVQRGPGFSLGSALSAGYERSGLGEELNVQALRLGPKLWFERDIRRATLRLGADMLATVGKIFQGKRRQSEPGDTGEPVEDNDLFSSSANPIYRSAAARNVIGAYAELKLPIRADWLLEAGLRTDTWITGGDAQSALEPRFLLRFQAKDWLALHAAAGLAYQPAVFLVPLPGISDVALDRGLQRAIQAEVGARFTLPYAFSVENKLFAHFYKDMLALESLEPGDVTCTGDPRVGELPPTPGAGEGVVTVAPIRCEETPEFGRISARAYGSEWLIRRAFSEPVSGWLSYTLAKATARSHDGRALTPNFDVRHMANLVVQWRITKGWHVALRGVAQSGRFPLGANLDSEPRERARLPAFFRGDLQVARTWPKRWGELRCTFDWLNFTFQREPLSWDCHNRPEGRCKVRNVGFPITVPLLGLRGSF